MGAGIALRAINAQVKGQKHRHDNNWESNCATTWRHVWMTGCQSLHDHIVNPNPVVRGGNGLEIDLEGLREYLWEYPDGGQITGLPLGISRLGISRMTKSDGSTRQL